MTLQRIAYIARCIDVALFAVGVASVVLWGWPTSWWGWTWLSSALLPAVALVVWALVRRFREPRLVRATMEYRRQKFGGFVKVPGDREPRTLRRPD